MTYANIAFSYGTERFIQKAASLGMDGLILPDVPFEEKEEFDSVCKKYGLDLISLVHRPPMSGSPRLQKRRKGSYTASPPLA